ncbi:Membrane protein UL43 [Caprine alphaherpesvirus 1]|uniref:Membrane protein UL43 n=1 Tax=Caprine alphaherpesvirus 1 TaxID=39944 RepID=A0AAF1D1Z5_9ALPH|nr:Membrane protein UL43 [Caprine alphaherpesvirus 1]QBM10857.1 Membrane protein UL43 [Caprine alphaherpesvirus 1]
MPAATHPAREARPEVLVAVGGAAALAAAGTDAAAALQDTCHYKIGQHAARRDLERGGAREGAESAWGCARGAAAELALAGAALASAPALWVLGRALSGELGRGAGGRWQTRDAVLLSAAAGHGAALAEHLCLRRARAEAAADGALIAHVGVCALGAALSLGGVDGGVQAALASAVAGALVTCVWLRRRARDLGRAAAARVARALHVAACACVGLCWAYADE